MLFPQQGSTERTERRAIRLPELRGRDTLHKPIDGHEEEDYCSPVSITAARVQRCHQRENMLRAVSRINSPL